MKSSTLVEAFASQIKEINKGITFINDSGKDLFLSYSDLYQKALTRLYYFQNTAKIQPGDKFIFQLEDNQEFIVSFWACLIGGIIPIPLTYSNNPEVINKLLNVWRIVGHTKIIMPDKLLRKIQKHIETSLAKTDVSFLDFEESTLRLEVVCAWEADNQGNHGQPAVVKPDDLAFIQFSSGSTGDPKGVMLSHRNIITNIYAISSSSKWTSSDKSLSWMPLTHDMGLIGLHLTPLVLQCNQFLMSTFLFAFYPLTWMQKVHEFGITITSCPNFGYEHFLSFLNDGDFKGTDLTSLRFILNGAEPISYKVCQKFLAQLKPYKLRQDAILPVYGLAEGTLAITSNPLGETISTHTLERTSLTMGAKICSTQNLSDSTVLVDVGTPVGQVKLEIRNDKGITLEDETVGLVFIKGENVTRGYFNNPVATNEVITQDGWLNTGDLGFLKDNRLTIIGRQKEILFVNGQNYYANDIERVAYEVEGVEMGKVGVCGIENGETGCDDIMVFVQFKKSLDEFKLLSSDVKYIIAKQTGIAVKFVIPVKKMPITTSGKVQRFALKENFLKGEYLDIINNLEAMPQNDSRGGEDIHVSTGNEFEEDILLCWKKNAGFTLKIGLTDNFFEAGGDSLLIAKVASDLSDKYPGKIAVTDFFACPTIAKLAATLKQRIVGQNTVFDTVAFKSNHLDANGKGKHNWSVKVDKEQLDLIFNGKYDAKQLEQLILVSYAFVIGKISEQHEIPIYLARNNQNTFLPCLIKLDKHNGFFQLLNSVQQLIEESNQIDNVILENMRKHNQQNMNQLSFMLSRHAYQTLHDRNVAEFYDSIVSFQHEDDLIIKFSVSARMKKETASILVNSMVSVIRNLAEHAKTMVQ